MQLRQYNTDSTQAHKEVMGFLSKVLFALHFLILIAVTITSENRVATFFINLCIPLSSRGLVYISLKSGVNLNWLVGTINATLIFFSCYISGENAMTWLPGITWLCGIFFMFKDMAVKIFWLLLGFTVIGVGSYLSGKSVYYIAAFEMSFVLFSVILDRAFSFLVLQNRKIEAQKNEIEHKQKEIIDSIRYAKRIQNSLMPTEKYLQKNLKK